MGCGQSKINLYPRRSKKSSKRNGAKRSGAIDTEAEEEEEEGSTGEPAPEEPEDQDNQQHVLPISDHQPAFEVSASQQNFFKMLDEKIEQGKDYDSTSETEIECEQERRRMLIEQWRSMSQSTSSSRQGSPPAPAPAPPAHRRLTRSIARAAERQCSPGPSKQPLCRQESLPARRSNSAQIHVEWDPSKSPVKRTQSAGANWKSGPKVTPFPKSKTSDETVAGCSKDSQITTTYNPTFQNHSPAHKAQIVSCPLSQQVAPPSPVKFIAPPEEYKDPEVVERQVAVPQVTTQSQIYYIHGSNTSAELAQQRQQTVINLQQYVAMKQAQQQMFSSYLQRPVFPDTPRMCEGEELAAQYGHPVLRAHSAPPRFAQEMTHLGAPLWSPLPPVAGSWQVPPEMQYYPQSQFVPMFRAGSAGTLSRRGDKVQSLSVVRGKLVGQVVGGAELAVRADSPSPAASSDSGVSPGTGPSSKSSGSTPPAPPAPETQEPKPKKKTRTLKVSKSLES